MLGICHTVNINRSVEEVVSNFSHPYKIYIVPNIYIVQGDFLGFYFSLQRRRKLHWPDPLSVVSR